MTEVPSRDVVVVCATQVFSLATVTGVLRLVSRDILAESSTSSI